MEPVGSDRIGELAGQVMLYGSVVVMAVAHRLTGDWVAAIAAGMLALGIAALALSRLGA